MMRPDDWQLFTWWLKCRPVVGAGPAEFIALGCAGHERRDECHRVALGGLIKQVESIRDGLSGAIQAFR